MIDLSAIFKEYELELYHEFKSGSIYRRDSPMQTLDDITSGRTDYWQIQFWEEVYNRYTEWFPDILHPRVKPRVLPLFGGNNTNTSEVQFALRGDTNYLDKLTSVISQAIYKFNYDIVIIDRGSEAITEDIVYSINHVCDTLMEKYPNTKFYLFTSTLNAKDYQYRFHNCTPMGVPTMIMRHFGQEWNNLEYPNTVREKTFLNFNRVPKPSRLYALGKLNQYDLLKHSITSFLFRDNSGRYIDTMEFVRYDQNTKQEIIDYPWQDTPCGDLTLSERRDMYCEIIDIINEHVLGKGLHEKNLVVDNPNVLTDNPVNFNPAEKDAFDRTWISLIQETHTNIFFGHSEITDGVFMSEKTGKALIYKHPFLVFSTHGHLRELKNLGFKTFSDVWDESYDEIRHPMQRFEAICEVLKELSKLDHDQWLELYDKLKPIVDYNFDLITNLKYKIFNIDKPITFL